METLGASVQSRAAEHPVASHQPRWLWVCVDIVLFGILLAGAGVGWHWRLRHVLGRTHSVGQDGNATLNLTQNLPPDPILNPPQAVLLPNLTQQQALPNVPTMGCPAFPPLP
eukprot:RCo020748